MSDQRYNKKRLNADDEGKRIIETDGRFFKSDIRDNLKWSADTFTSTDDASKVGWIPDTLCHFLKQVI